MSSRPGQIDKGQPLVASVTFNSYPRYEREGITFFETRRAPLTILVALDNRRRFAMALPVPGVNGFTTNVVALSKLNGPLEVSIPDSAEIAPLDDVYAVLEENGENPEWCGSKVQAGQWNDETEEVERVARLSVSVPRKELERRLHTTVALLYQTSGESGLVSSSASLELRIEP
jgi:hypothetical protein